jgi:hypothetical protein
LRIPNRAPDIIAKFVVDPSKRLHAEIAGIARFFQLYNPLTATHYSATGAGGFPNVDAGTPVRIREGAAEWRCEATPATVSPFVLS